MFKDSLTSGFGFLLSVVLIVATALPAAQAETVNQSSDWLFTGAAAQVGDSYVLTTGSPRESGSVFLSEAICAREFKLGFEIDLGGDVSPIGGDGVFISFHDTNSDPLFRVHTDSFFHGFEDPRFELDGNHVSVEAVGAYYDIYGNAPTSGNTTFGPIVAGKAPFTMEGSGWFYGEIYRLGRVLKITITNGTAGLLLTTYLPSGLTQNVTPGFEGIAMNGMNEQKIRNISLNVLNSEGCADYVPPLSLNQARALIVDSCGDVASCPDETDYLSCVTLATQELLTDERITGVTAELLELEAQYGLSFCSGYEQCEVDIDTEAVRQSGYDEGYTAGVTDGDAAGYDRGLSEGDSAGYTRGFAAGEISGYSTGYTAGDAAGYNRGFSAGDTAGYTRGFSIGQAAGYDLGFADGESAGIAKGDAAGFTRGYDQGQSDGIAAGYASGINDGQAAGYSEGFSDGDAAGYSRGYDRGLVTGQTEGDATGYVRGLEDGKDLGFDEGFSAGYDEGIAAAPVCDETDMLSLEEALSTVKEKCSCSKYRWHGARVVCSIFSAKKLHDEGKIESSLKGKIVSSIARNKCK